MKKKLVYSAILCIIALSTALYHYSQRPKNIFDEIYQETKKTYRTNNILGNIDEFEIRGSWSSDNPDIAKTPFGKYIDEALTDNDYYDVYIDFNFKTKYKTILISFKKRVSSNAKVWILCKYNSKSKVLNQYAQIILDPEKASNYIENESEVRSYLKEYGITSEDLDSYYDEIVNQKVLTDWCSIYDSHFSPDDYGDMTVETQWENW